MFIDFCCVFHNKIVDVVNKKNCKNQVYDSTSRDLKIKINLISI